MTLQEKIARGETLLEYFCELPADAELERIQLMINCSNFVDKHLQDILNEIERLETENSQLRAELDKAKPKHKGDPEAFEAFYKAYPNKKAKAAAQKAWDKLAPDPELIETIMKALEAQKRSEAWLNEGGKFIPYPERWLKNKRWADEIKFVQIKSAKGTPKFDYEQRQYAPGELDNLFETFGGKDDET